MSTYALAREFGALNEMALSLFAAFDGKSMVKVEDLDQVEGTGFYFFAAAAANNPRPGFDGRLIHLEEENGEATQFAAFGKDAFMVRDRDLPSDDPNQEYGPWRAIVLSGERKVIDDGDTAFDANWILAANMFGDTAITCSNYKVIFLIMGNIAHVSGFFDIEDFAATIPSDASWNIDLDLGAMAVAAGAFTNIDGEPFGNATVEFEGGGEKAMLQSVFARVRDQSATLANSIEFSSTQTDTGGLAGNSNLAITEGRIRFNITLMVSA
ncbi:hypothetical protein [Planktotalea sp.]|uniref:hypothetical protein n=1 Tax=Planktotalea sp. TaxID=2029877 RepID=UPI003D6C3F16